jgi:hypothetical protein
MSTPVRCLGQHIIYNITFTVFALLEHLKNTGVIYKKTLDNFVKWDPIHKTEMYNM